MYNQNIPGRNEAIISLVLGIVGLVASLFVNSLVGLLVGVAGLYYASRSKAMGYDDGLRLAGFVLSVVAIVLACSCWPVSPAPPPLWASACFCNAPA